MIARYETPAKEDLWARLGAPVNPAKIGWRQDGKAVQRNGGWVARFVAYIDANTVRERLDSVVPGEWDVTLEVLPPAPVKDTASEALVSVKARIQILGVIRENIGAGRDWKAAATDAFKRAATSFGIGQELYDFEQNWVAVDSDSRFAKPVEDPGAAYQRRHGGARVGTAALPQPIGDATETFDREVRPQDDPVPTATASPRPSAGGGEQSCPKCGGRMWDNRIGKRNPKAPDWKCRDKSCDGVIWPPKGAGADVAPSKAKPGREVGSTADRRVAEDSEPSTDGLEDVIAEGGAGDDDDLPF